MTRWTDPAPPRAELLVKLGCFYLVEEPSPQAAIRLFAELCRHHPAMGVSRLHPEVLRDRYAIEADRLIWLHQQGPSLPDSIRPQELGVLFREVERFVPTAWDWVLWLEGVEYLIVHNGFSRVLRTIQDMQDLAIARQGRLLVSVDPETLAPTERALLRRGAQCLGGTGAEEVLRVTLSAGGGG